MPVGIVNTIWESVAVTILLNTDQAAVELGLSKTTLEHWRMVRKGPRFAKIGPRCIRYRRTDLDEWIESCVDANEKPRG